MQFERNRTDRTMAVADTRLPPPEFAEMEAVSPFQLAAWWSERAPCAAGTADIAAAQVRELAVMCALEQWLHRWVPLKIHRALRDGAGLGQVAAATGRNTAGLLVEWTQWAVEQRQRHEQMRQADSAIGLSSAEYEQVRAIFHRAPDEHED